MLPTRASPDDEITIMGITNSEDFDSKDSNHEPETDLVGNHQEQLLPQSDDENQELKCLPSPQAHHTLQQAEQRFSVFSTFLPRKAIPSPDWTLMYLKTIVTQQDVLGTIALSGLCT